MLAVLLIGVPGAHAAKDRVFKETFGSASEPTFGKAFGMAVDPDTGDVLVIDQDVNGAAAGTPGTVSRWHRDGTPSEFPALGTNVIDGSETPEGNLNGFGNFPTETQIAVDDSGTATDGNIYVTQSPRELINIFSSDGEYLGRLTQYEPGPGAEGELVPMGEACGVGVDESGVVYVGDYSKKQIHKYAPSGVVPTNADNVANFAEGGTGVERPCTLALGTGPSAGFLFVNNYNGPTRKLGAVDGTPAYVVSEGSNTTVTVDPVTGNVAVAKGTRVHEFNASGESSTPIYPALELGAQVRGIAIGIEAEEDLLYLNHAGTSNVLVDLLLEVPPRIEAQWVIGAGTTEASVGVSFGPEEQATTYHVEYLTEAAYEANGESFSGLNTPQRAPVPDASVGTESTHAVRLIDLTPGIPYRWRFVATSPAGTTEAPVRMLFTHEAPAHPPCSNEDVRTGPAANLPDCRAYELVSPVDKNGGDISAYFFEGFDAATSFAGLDQATPDGSKFTYTASAAFADPEGSPLVHQYMAVRKAENWTGEPIDPPMQGGVTNEVLNSDSQFKAFSEDLSFGWLVPETGHELSSGPTKGFQNLYRRDNSTDMYTWLESSAPEPEPCMDPGCPFPFLFPEPQGYSVDGGCAAYRVNDALTAEAPRGIPGGASQLSAWQLYLWCEGASLRLASRLPNGEPFEGVSSAGTEYPGTDPSVNAEARLDTVENALSEDGTRLYWTTSSAEHQRLFLRINAGQEQSTTGCEAGKACTLQVSPAGFENQNSKVQFWTASGDGERAILEVTVGPDADKLYEYAFDPETTSGSRTQIAGQVLGVAGSSEDATTTYFASREVCAPGAEAGKANLFRHDAGESCAAQELELVGVLAEEDVSSGGQFGFPSPLASVPRDHIARATPDGEHLLFVSAAQLTDYDNADVSSGQLDREVYLYASGTEEVRCVSCNPSGARPSGANLSNGKALWTAAWIPGYQHQLYGRRLLSADGQRVFFNSLDSLALRDVNGVQDVYQWEAAGKGTCTTDSSTYSPQNKGCVDLLSSGKSPGDSEFVEASESGDDVFIRTEESLVGKDPGSVDIYDARVGGGFAEPAPEVPCEGDSCQSVPPAPPYRAPASEGFQGPPNPRPTADCRVAARRAGKLSRRAKRLRGNAKRVSKSGKARQMRRKSSRLARRAKAQSNRAKRCRRARNQGPRR